jgi:hypothetical protein
MIFAQTALATEPNYDPLGKWNLLVQSFVAIGTILAVILAIWGDLIRSVLVPPKLRLHVHNPRGTPTQFNDGQKVYFYHLRVKNSRTWSPARNCHVTLRELYRRGPDQLFHPVALPVPVQFIWAPAEFTPPRIHLVTEQVLDFGTLTEHGRFTPRLAVMLNDFKGFVNPNDAVRFCLEICADGYHAARFQVFEVAWNGKWSENPNQMAENLQIREIETPAKI